MPKNTPIKANSIDEARLPPHLRHRSYTSSIILNKEPQINRELYYTSTFTNIGDLLYLDVDGYLKKADNATKPAEYIALTSGDANTLIEVNSKGIIEITLSYNDGTQMFLGTSGGLTDVSPTSPNSILQPIGIYSDGKLRYIINEWYIYE